MVPRPEFGSIHESGPERCRSSPASQKQVGAESVQVKDGIIPTFPRGIGAPGRHWRRASPSYAPMAPPMISQTLGAVFLYSEQLHLLELAIAA